MSVGRAVGNPGDGKLGLPRPPDSEPPFALLLVVVMIDLGEVTVMSLVCKRGDDCREWVV